MERDEVKYKALYSCSSAREYKGTRAPRCAGGLGCRACWKKYAEALEDRMSGMIKDPADFGWS